MRNPWIIMAYLCIAALSACGGGGGGGGAASTTVSGSALKGPYQAGATVTVYQVTTTGARGAQVATGTVTDNAGHYSVSIPTGTTGPFEFVVSGSYLDEITGSVVTTPQPTSMIVPDAATAAAGQANLNPVATIQAELAKQMMATGASPAAAIQSAGKLALQTFGIPTTDAGGNPVDPTSVDIFNPATDPKVAAALISASATVSALINNGAVNNVSTFATAVAKDLKNGVAPGSAGSQSATVGATSAQLSSATTTVKNNASTILTNITTASGATTPVTTTTMQTAANNQPNPATLRGMAIALNQFTIGTAPNNVATYTIGTNGAATNAAGTTVAKNNVVVSFTFKDYTNATGNGASAGTDLTTFNFDIKSANDPRHIHGTLSPVQVVRDGTGKVSITVPANAVLTYTGTDSAGVTVTGTATNVAANVIQATNSVVTIDANALLTTIQNKVNKQQLNILQTAGTFNFDFSVGLNVGLENGAGTGLSQLLPVTATGGRGITGTITTF